MSMSCQPARLLLFLLFTSLGSSSEADLNQSTHTSIYTPSKNFAPRQLKEFFGDPSCPCLPLDQLPPPPDVVVDAFGRNVTDIDASIYGIACGSHDQHVGRCETLDGDEKPLWCQRAWCWVDDQHCTLQYGKSLAFENRWYSYATCRNIDFWRGDARIEQLSGRVLRVALIHNEETYRGSHSDLKQDFNGSLADWHGPTISMIRIAAERSNMHIQLINSIPSELASKAVDFFGHNANNLDICVYATAIGLVDICASFFKLQPIWHSTTTFAVLGSLPIKLVIQDDFFLTSDPKLYLESIDTIFEPFHKEAWAFLIGFIIPMLGILIMINEYGMIGSVYPKSETVVYSYVDDNDEQKLEIKERIIPLIKHVLRAFYSTTLSVLVGKYPLQVVSLGGQITLIGISFMLLTIVAVYTANLSALLVAEVRFGRVDTLEASLARGQRMCALRPVMHDIISIYGINEAFFVTDPNDGKPGFACDTPSCGASRRRLFDFMDPDLAKKEEPGANAVYCHVALASEDDLLVLQDNGEHCNKTMPDRIISDQFWGVPLFEGISQELTTLLLTLKNENILNQLMAEARPQKICRGLKVTVASETSELNSTQLLGIWVVSFSFAILGLIVSLTVPQLKKLSRRRYGRHVHVLFRSDQTGQALSRIELGESALATTILADRLQLSSHSSLTENGNNSGNFSKAASLEDLDREESLKLSSFFTSTRVVNAISPSRGKRSSVIGAFS